ncbi:MAG: hypothetical protein Q8911_00140 [Bacillota bacterium]|nr:hypothetical protein [Bacillota bacterium]
MNMKENYEGIHGQFKKCSILTDIESHYSSSSEKIETKCNHEYIRMQYAEEEFKCVRCGMARPEVDYD